LTPTEFKATCIRIYGRKLWYQKFARDIGISEVTVFRQMKKEQIPGPYEVALKGMLVNAMARRRLEREQRSLLHRSRARKKRVRKEEKADVGF